MNEPAFCSAACPFGFDVRSFVEKVRQHRLSAAFKQYRDAVVFPGIVSKLCDRPCEKKCPLSGVDRAIDIRGLEELVTGTSEDKAPEAYNLPPKGKKIAVIGAGLSGLACALKLAQKKYEVEVFEAAAYIDESISEEINLRFKNEELILKTECTIDSLDGFFEAGYDAIYIATGTGGNHFGLCGNSDALKGTSDVPGETSGAFLPAKTVPHTGASLKKLGSCESSHGSRGGLHDLAADAGVCIVSGGSLIGSEGVYAIADGIIAAASIEAFLKTGILNTERPSSKTEMVLAPIHLERYKQSVQNPQKMQKNINEAAAYEADRCLLCRCDACMTYCDLPAYTAKWPPRIRDEVFATTLPGKAEVKATPAKRLINMDNLSGVFKDVCPVGIDMDALLLAGRQSMHRQDKMPWAFHEFWLRDMEHANGEAASLVIAGKTKRSTALAFFPGCQLGAASPDLVKAAWDELLSMNDVLLSANKEENLLAGLILKCCGAPALWAGDEELFMEVLGTIKKDWESLGKPALVCACPSCMRIFDTYMPEVETISLYEVLLDIKVLKQSNRDPDCRAADAARNDIAPVIASIAKQSGEGMNTRNDNGPWAVFDACAAARLPDTKKSERLRYSVRKIAEAMGIGLRPLPVQEEVPRCCGFGGQPELAGPNFIIEVREDRAAESELPYICYCMNCREAFLKAGKESLHILEMLYQGASEEGVRAPELSPSLRRANRELLRSGLLRSVRNDEGRACDDPSIVIERNNVTKQSAITGDEAGSTGFDLGFAEGVLTKMDKDLILTDDVRTVVEHTLRTGEYVIHPKGGLLNGSLVIGRTTYWASFTENCTSFTENNAAGRQTSKTEIEPRFTVTSVYTHRLAIVREAVWTDPRGDKYGDERSGFYCAKHDTELIEMEAEFSYLGRFFKHMVLRCPVCGYVYIAEELARGRMREVEMALEDK